MTPADRHTLARKLEYLRKNIALLEPYRTKKREDLENSVERYALERLVQTALESVIDCSRLLAALSDLRRLREEQDALLVLAEHKIIDEELAERLIQAKGLRNVLVHRYAEVDLDLLLQAVHGGLSDLEEFAHALAKWMERESA